jgi:uncharacterized membrane protein YozB (DUF420 family)
MDSEQTKPVKLKLPFQRHPWDRHFYLAFVIAACAVVLFGFGPTYYFRLLGSDAPISTIVHLHAIVFSLWMVLFLVQTILVEIGRVNLHKTLGMLGLLLAVAIVIIGFKTMIEGGRTGYLGPGVERNLEFSSLFMIVPLRDLVWFVGCLAMALFFRNTPETHKRLMILLFVGGLLGVVLARVPGPLNSMVGFAFLLIPPIYDMVTRRRIHLVYWIGIPIFIMSTILAGVIGETAAWKSFADWLVG